MNIEGLGNSYQEDVIANGFSHRVLDLMVEEPVSENECLSSSNFQNVASRIISLDYEKMSPEEVMVELARINLVVSRKNSWSKVGSFPSSIKTLESGELG